MNDEQITSYFHERHSGFSFAHVYVHVDSDHITRPDYVLLKELLDDFDLFYWHFESLSRTTFGVSLENLAAWKHFTHTLIRMGYEIISYSIEGDSDEF